MMPAGAHSDEATHIHRGTERDTSDCISLKKRKKRLLLLLWARDFLRVCDEKRSAARKVTAYCAHKRLLLKSPFSQTGPSKALLFTQG